MAKSKLEASLEGISSKLKDVRKELSSVSKAKISLMERKDVEAVKDLVDKLLPEAESELKQIKMRKEEILKTNSTLVTNSAQQVKNQKELVRLIKEEARLKNQIGKMGALGAASAGAMSGAGMPMVPQGGGLLGKIAAGASVYGAGKALFGRFQRGSQIFNQGIEDRIKLRGRGFTDMDLQNPELAGELGISSLDMRKRRLQAQEAFGAQGASQVSVLNRAQFETAKGLESGSLTELGKAIRSTTGSARVANDTVNKSIAMLNASAFEDAIGPYLAAIQDTLAEINKTGNINNTEILMAMGRLTSMGNLSPEKAGRVLGSIDQAIKGGTGDQAAFFRSAFGQAGIGGGTMGGTRLATEGGLFGYDPRALSEGLTGSRKGLMQGFASDFGGGFKERGTAVLDKFRESVGLKEGQSIGDLQKMSKTQRNMAAVLASSIFGGTGAQGMQSMALLEEGLSGKSGMSMEDIQKKMKSMNLSESDKRLEDIKNSSEGQLRAVQTMSTSIGDKLGESTSNIEAGITRMVSQLDSMLAGFGITDKEELKKSSDIIKQNYAPEFATESMGVPSNKLSPKKFTMTGEAPKPLPDNSDVLSQILIELKKSNNKPNIPFTNRGDSTR